MSNYLDLCYYPLMNLSGNRLSNVSFTVWYDKDFGVCFEYLLFSALLGALFGVFSAYYSGLKRTKIQRRRISLILVVRALISFCILLAFVVDLVGSFWLASGRPYSVIFSLVVLIIAWSIHLFYMWVLIHSVNHYGRGPLNLNALWILVFVGNIFQFRTTIRWRLYPDLYSRSSLPMKQAYFSELSEITVYVLFGLQCLYGATILFKVNRVTGDNVRMYPASTNTSRDKYQWSDDTENSVKQHLISSEWKTEHVATSYGSLTASYNSGLTMEADFGKIEASEDGANLLSRLSFWWVGPLLRRGSLGLLQKPEDLLQLPESLETSRLRRRFQKVCGLSEGGVADGGLENRPNREEVKAEHVSVRTTKGEEDEVKSKADDCSIESDDSDDSEVWYDSLTVNMRGDTPSAADQVKAQRQKKRVSASVRTTGPESSHASLFWSLNRSFGMHYYPLGIFKLLADMLGFSGPLLLHALVSFMENRTVSFKYRVGCIGV